MENLDPFIFGALTFGGGATMMALHWDKKFRLKFKEQTDDESRFHRSQYVRRMITSGLIALVGILFMVYCAYLIVILKEYTLRVPIGVRGFIAGLLPIGTFVFDGYIRKQKEVQESMVPKDIYGIAHQEKSFGDFMRMIVTI